MLDKFELYLNNFPLGPEGIVLDSVKYSLFNPGKRIRPMILLSLLKDYNIEVEKGYSAGLAIEMIHNYSLIHDDLPSMDNDDYRRGKLSNHKVFGEDIAILAGDALLTLAFSTISDDPLIKDNIKVKLISLLSKHAGIDGMIYGQQLDLTAAGMPVSINDVDLINIYKTSNLIMFSMLAAAVIANKQEDLDDLEKLASKLGLAFQIQDDVFDVTKTFEELGKKPSDEVNNKSTYVKLLGLDKSKMFLNSLFKECYQILEKLNLKDKELFTLIEKIEKRSN